MGNPLYGKLMKLQLVVKVDNGLVYDINGIVIGDVTVTDNDELHTRFVTLENANPLVVKLHETGQTDLFFPMNPGRSKRDEMWHRRASIGSQARRDTFTRVYTERPRRGTLYTRAGDYLVEVIVL